MVATRNPSATSKEGNNEKAPTITATNPPKFFSVSCFPTTNKAKINNKLIKINSIRYIATGKVKKPLKVKNEPNENAPKW